MKRPGVLTWLFALMLAVSMFGPVIAQVSAQDVDVTPVAEITTVADEVVPPDSAVTDEVPAADETAVQDEVTEEPSVIAEGTEVSGDGAEVEVVPTDSDPELPIGDDPTLTPDTQTIPEAELDIPEIAVDVPVDAADVVAVADEVPTASLTLYKVDQSNNRLPGAGFTIYDEPTCSTVIAAEQFVGAADDPDPGNVGRVTFNALPIGMVCVVETTVPAGYTGSEPLYLTIGEQGTSWSVVNTYIPAGDLTLYKVDQDNARVPGAGFTVYDESCTTIIRTEQIVGAADDPNAGNVGRTVFEDLPLGWYCVVETTTPAGYTGSDPVVIELIEGGTSWSLINTRIFADLSIYKVDTENARVPGAGITIYDETCTTIVRSEQIVGAADDPDPGNVGRAIFEDLPTGKYCVVETTVPEGYTGSDSVVVDVVEGGTSWSLINERQTGTFEIQKLVCPGDPADSRIEINHGVDAAEMVACELVTTGYTFLIYPFGDEPAIGPVGPGSYEGIPTTTSTGGLHRIVEVGAGLEAEFSLDAGEHLVIRVLNFVLPTGSLSVTKIFCDPEITGVTFDVFKPVEDIDSFLIRIPDGCWFGDATFLIYPYADKEAVPIVFTTKEGSALIEGLPATTVETGPHLLVEQSTGATITFNIIGKMVTPVLVTNLYTAHHPHHDKPVTEVTEVKELPNTGAGPVDDQHGLVPIFALLLVVFVGGVAVRRKVTH